jgi:tol-pal system protein YbgF
LEREVNVSTFNKLLLAITLVVLVSGPAYPQNKDILQLQTDVIKLQQQVRQLQISVDEKNDVIRSLVEKMVDQMSGVTTSIQKITQTVETVNQHSDKNAADLRALVTTLNNRVTELTDNLSTIRSQVSGVSQQITSMKSTAEPLPGPDEVWRSAQTDLLIGAYDLAIEEFSNFLAKFPGDPRASEAQLRKGDALYSQNKWDQAIVEYDLFLQKYPENSNTKAALLKKGLAQAELKDPAASATLKMVVDKYPKTVEATNAAQMLKTLTAPGARGRRP